MKGKKRRAIHKMPLREFIEAAGWSVFKAGQAAGMGNGQIYNLTSGRRQPSWETLLRIRNAIQADFALLDKLLSKQPIRKRRPRKAATETNGSGGEVAAEGAAVA